MHNEVLMPSTTEYKLEEQEVAAKMIFKNIVNFNKSAKSCIKLVHTLDKALKATRDRLPI